MLFQFERFLEDGTRIEETMHPWCVVFCSMDAHTGDES
jgi:hypothetical protein